MTNNTHDAGWCGQNVFGYILRLSVSINGLIYVSNFNTYAQVTSVDLYDYKLRVIINSCHNLPDNLPDGR